MGEIVSFCSADTLSALMHELKRRGDHAKRIGNIKRARRYYRLCARAAFRWEQMTGRKVEFITKEEAK